MKLNIVIILTVISNILAAQVKDTSFRLNFNIKGKEVENHQLDLTNSNFKADFTINNSSNSKYSIKIISDSISILTLFINNHNEVIDTIKHTDYFISDSNSIYLPRFTIRDFNKDGVLDLLCWVESNMNDNEWLFIYLYNPKQKS